MNHAINLPFGRLSGLIKKTRFHPNVGRGCTLAMLLTSLCLPVLASDLANQMPGNKPVLTIKAAIALANRNDPWLRKSESIERTFINKADAASALPDPVMSLQLANVPVNGFDFNQEAMTQLKVGIAQTLPRGDSRAISQRYQNALSLQYPINRQEREAQTRLNVSSLWLAAFHAQASVNLINSNKNLFEQLGEIVRANYASIIGETTQQDIIRADLELTKIEDRIIQLKANQESVSAQLRQWMQSDVSIQGEQSTLNSNFVLPHKLYDIPTLPSELFKVIQDNEYSALAKFVAQHPAVKNIDQAILASESAIDLAKQQYKPQWQLNASYAYRQDDALGSSRADFLSLGVSVSLPLFNRIRPDSEVSVAVNQGQALITEKRIVMRELMGKLRSAVATYKRLIERRELYTKLVIPQMVLQATFSENAYTNDSGDFTEVVRAKIAELDAQLTRITIETDLRKTVANIEYLLTTTRVTKDFDYAN